MATKGTVEDLRIKLNEASNSYQLLLQRTHEEALLQNELQTKAWNNYRRDYEELRARLLSFRDKLSHPIMVPLGKKALMRGSLVHTNEILVCLGDGWFAKQSAKQATEICQRRIQNCDEVLKKLQKEHELLSTRKSFTFDSEAFAPADETQEVIEPYNEEDEKQWRERHRQKEREYHQKLAELKKNQKTEIESEQDLWDRLDALDLQEELEDELNRMHENEEDEDEDTEESEEDTSESDSNEENDTGQSDVVDKNKVIKRKVSFKEDKENDRNEEHKDSNTNDDNLIRICFKHSEVLPAAGSDVAEEIVSPADIYTQYTRQKMPKSILKPSSSTEALVSEFLLDAPNSSVVNHQIKETTPSSEQPIPLVQAVGEVVERDPSVVCAPSSERPVSRFKASRMNKR